MSDKPAKRHDPLTVQLAKHAPPWVIRKHANGEDAAIFDANSRRIVEFSIDDLEYHEAIAAAVNEAAEARSCQVLSKE